jgi:putative transposase
MALKKQFNAIKYIKYPWIQEIHRDAHAQPFAHLAKAWNRFFADMKAGKPAHEPKFKKKGRCRDSFYVANDKFSLNGNTIRLPKIGEVKMTERLRFSGKILGATVSRTADRWFVAIHVDVSDEQFYRKRTAHNMTGVDLGLKAAATLSNGGRHHGAEAPHGCIAASQDSEPTHEPQAGDGQTWCGACAKSSVPKHARRPKSNNCKKSAAMLARLHARIANIRADFVHKLTTRLCRENQAVAIEDLNVKGMLANERLARAISDVGFGMVRAQLEYKARRYGTRLAVADRWYPSSRLCSVCGWKNEALTLTDREWTCPECDAHHDRDHNAALNLKRLATVTALPVASPSSDGGTALEGVSIVVGKVTPVRYEEGHRDPSGQEENRAHLCARS